MAIHKHKHATQQPAPFGPAAVAPNPVGQRFEPSAAYAGAYGARQPPAPAPRRKGVHPLLVILIALLTLVLGALLGTVFLGNLIPRPQQPIASTITESQLDEPVGSYTYEGERFEITARQAIEDSVSLSSVRNDDGTYKAPTADMVMSYARNRILADKVAEAGIVVSDEELNDYLQQLSGTTDLATIANTYGMDVDQARTILTEAAGVKALRDQVIGEVPAAPQAPQAPENGDTETANADYATYIIALLGDAWDSAHGTWANQDNVFYAVLKDATFSADSANYEAAQLAYYVAYQQYQSTTTTVSSQWTDYVNQFMVNGAVTVNTLLS